MKLKPILGIMALIAALIAAQLVLRLMDKEYYLTQLTMSLYYAIVVIGLCFVMGYAGQISLGHGAFFAIGGYTTAILTTEDFSRFQDAAWSRWLKQAHVFVVNEDIYGVEMLNVSPWAAFIAAMVLTFVIACLIGYPALRLKGHYLAMATLGFGLIVHKIIIGSTITGATDGVHSVPEWSFGGVLEISDTSKLRVQNYYIACGVALLLILLLRNVVRSRVGRALLAIHDHETAANAMGINTARYKLKAFVASALLAAIAGVLLTHYTGGINPSEAGALKSVRYVALVAASGMTNLWGAAVVSTFLNFLSLRGWFGSYDNAVFGVILIAIMVFAPEGPLKPLGNLLRRFPGRWFAGTRSNHGAT